MYHLSDQSFLNLDSEPFASGGEGNLFKMIELNGNVAKIYHPNKRNAEREAKIKYMLTHKPDFQKFGHSAAIWVSDIVYDSGNFAGFSMPYAQGIKLEYLCGSKIPPFLGNEWKKYDLRYKDAFYLRLKLCFNIAVAISQIHTTGHYVITDLKPDNIIINSAGLVSIVDIDSFQISVEDKVLFPATAQTPEYSPSSDKNFTQEWDRFSIAVIFYRLLFGIHPFTGSCHAPYENSHSIEEMIKNRLCPHLEDKKAYFKIIPPPHLKFARLDTQTRALFLQALGNEQRPSAEMWAQALYAYSKMNVVVELEEETKPVVISKPQIGKTVDFEKAKKLYVNEFDYYTEGVTNGVGNFITMIAKVIAYSIAGILLLILSSALVGVIFASLFASFSNDDEYDKTKQVTPIYRLVSAERLPLSWQSSIKLYYDGVTDEYALKTLNNKPIATYSNINIFENQKFAKVWKDGKFGIIDETGREVAPCIYNGFEPLIGVTNEQGMYAFIDMGGELVTDYIYNDVSTFKDLEANYIMVWRDKKVGLVNREGKEVVPCKYDWIENIKLHQAVVRLNGRQYLINF